jgi:hypothetical protein
MVTGRHRSGPSPRAILASDLQALLAGKALGSEFTLDPAADICCTLEHFIPTVLVRQFPEWASESLDGIFVARAIKTGAGSAELVGTCILISDQTVTPFRIVLTLSSSGEDVEVERLCLGEPGTGRLGISGPACNSSRALKVLATVVARLDTITWSYDVGREAG